ncbi:MAG: hypothetical protein B7Z55_05800 [Planctomycetales bacterium 12-60-4]|nr:MAG: hypothetical protein B7Z55_05800 [Planctomycetales bacterium 12-60-4]
MLGVAGAMAVRDVYPELSPVVDVVFPIDARRYLPTATAQQTVQLLIASLTFAIDLRTDQGLIARSQAITSTLRDFIANEGPLRVLRLLNQFRFKQMLPRVKYPNCVIASSLGQLSLPASPSGVRVVECGWLANGGIHLPAFMQTSATIDGRFAVTSYSTWIAPHRLRALAERTDFRLREFAGLANSTSALPESAHRLSATSPA